MLPLFLQCNQALCLSLALMLVKPSWDLRVILTTSQDMATRILAAWWVVSFSGERIRDWFIPQRYLMGQDSGFPAVNFNAWNLNAAVNTHANVQADHKKYLHPINEAISLLITPIQCYPRHRGCIYSALEKRQQGPAFECPEVYWYCWKWCRSKF